MGGAGTLRPWSERLWEKSFAEALGALPGTSSGQGDSDASSDSDSEPADTPAAEADAKAPVGRDGIAASAPAHELALARQLAKDPWGRFGGREGKMARIAAAEAAHTVAAGEAATQQQSKRQRASQEAAAAAAAAASEAAKAAQAVVPYPSAGKKRGHDGEAEGVAASGKRSKTAAAGEVQHWWSSMFQFAGALEGALHPHRPASGLPEAVAVGFTGTEAEQLALCEAAHASKASGRRGLGQGRKEPEAQWQGTKLTFTDPVDEEGDAQGEGEGEDALGRIKWKKLAASVLEAHPKGKLSEKKLRKATLAAAAGSLGAAPPDKGVLRAWFERRVLKSSKFLRTACGKVALASNDGK